MRTLCRRGGVRGLCPADPFSKRKLAVPLAPPGTLDPVACSASGGPFRGPSAKRRSGAPRCALCVGRLCFVSRCVLLTFCSVRCAPRCHARPRRCTRALRFPHSASRFRDRWRAAAVPGDNAFRLRLWTLLGFAHRSLHGRRRNGQGAPDSIGTRPAAGGSAANAVVEDTASPQSEPALHSPRAPTPHAEEQTPEPRLRSTGVGAPPRRTGVGTAQRCLETQPCRRERSWLLPVPWRRARDRQCGACEDPPADRRQRQGRRRAFSETGQIAQLCAQQGERRRRRPQATRPQLAFRRGGDVACRTERSGRTRDDSYATEAVGVDRFVGGESEDGTLRSRRRRLGAFGPSALAQGERKRRAAHTSNARSTGRETTPDTRGVGGARLEDAWREE
ncbi:hypothetical protein ERJ75_001281600 [Trypanosoma vivax]|nr:hypothetical protein ERJ75_001281600 [Trypanosoma vivax]